MARNKIPADVKAWIEARKRYRLSHAHIQMARELGMNPKKLGGSANQRQEPWKSALPQFIEQLYARRFGKPAPDRRRKLERRAGIETRLLERVEPVLAPRPIRFRTNRGSVKISAALIELIQPYLEGGITVDEYREILALGALAWNLSLFDDEARRNELSMALRKPGFSELADSAAFGTTLESLVDRKKQLFPQDRRFVAAFDVIEDRGRYHVTAAASELE